MIYHLGVAGLLIALAINLAVRFYSQRRADEQENRIHRGRERQMQSLQPTENEVAAEVE
ncbi:MAG: hypothetical protein ACUVQR_09995 [Thermogutta sp.]